MLRHFPFALTRQNECGTAWPVSLAARYQAEMYPELAGILRSLLIPSFMRVAGGRISPQYRYLA
jgi:hypothetical protein